LTHALVSGMRKVPAALQLFTADLAVHASQSELGIMIKARQRAAAQLAGCTGSAHADRRRTGTAIAWRRQQLVRTLWKLGEDRQSGGLLGMLGMGTASPYPAEFRLIVRVVATFVADRFTDPVYAVAASDVAGYKQTLGTRGALTAMDMRDGVR